MLRKCNILPLYNTKSNNVLEEFYIPLLSNCKEYKRVSAYFDSHILELYSSGIENIVLQNGHIYFIFSCEISEQDYELMKEGYSNREKIEKMLLEKVENPVDTIDYSNLAHLIASGYVDIKIAFTKAGIFHDKYGLIIENDDVIYFRGSNNETVAAIKNNYESFETSASWISDIGEKRKIQSAVRDFETLWNNKSEGILVVDLPEIVREEIVKYDTGKLLLSYSKKENCYVFDYDGKNMIGINNIKHPNNYYISNITNFYNNYLSLYIKSDVDKTITFLDELSYVEMKEIIKKVNDLGQSKGFEVYVSPKLRIYLLSNDISIEKRRNLGIAIKQRHPSILEGFKTFKNTLGELMERPLREPQMWDSYHIVEMMRSANFSVPGAGKTSIVYGAFAYLHHLGEVDKIVMVGPINSFMAWRNEFSKNFGDKLTLKYFDYQEMKANSSGDRYDQIVYKSKGCNLFLINYDALITNEFPLKEIIDSKTLLVFDEVHRIKSTTGKRATAALHICNRARYRVVLTGTPIPNGYVDIFNFLHILFGEEYDSFFNFTEQFLKKAKNSQDNQREINEKIYPFFCRTTKADLNVPLPEPDDIETGYCLFSDDECELFRIIYKKFGSSILQLYIRLMQASTNPSLLLKNISIEDMHSFDTEDEDDDFSSLLNYEGHKNTLTNDEKDFVESFDMTRKFWRALDIVDKIANDGNTVIVWGIFIDTLERFKNECRKRDITCEMITGSVPPFEREKIINDFTNGKFKVLITNPHTLAESVSLHTICHHALYLEYSFNLVHMLQSRDRIHRLGLKNDQKTYYYYMMLDNGGDVYNSIDKRIYERLLLKEDLQRRAIEGNDLVFVEESSIIEDIESLKLI